MAKRSSTLAHPGAVIVTRDFTEAYDTDGVGALEGHLINRGANSSWGIFVGAADTDGSTVLWTGFEYAQYFGSSILDPRSSILDPRLQPELRV